MRCRSRGAIESGPEALLGFMVLIRLRRSDLLTLMLERVGVILWMCSMSRDFGIEFICEARFGPTILLQNNYSWPQLWFGRQVSCGSDHQQWAQCYSISFYE